ncbi:MAG: hypothetical protein E7275_03240 [Pseudobutyrivibrio sp.]|uniref:hypothetical protein n=1 Tax=Pseudobutyrivibrio sp. TaxID=2014367 RepID=UPI0025E5F290|nr:hypothetical protein [Pseudobutyrivibrio sp.]MBE5903281.1 hypothetical protein [Pseudobutyrivibrio sp.]
MGEAFDTLKKYFSKERNTVHYHGNSILVTKLEDALFRGTIIEFDAPDIYIKLENVVWIIEHFEFDCSHSNRKGSSFKREEYRVANAEEKIVTTEQGALFHDKIKAESSYRYYVDNVTKIFQSHYSKINTYKDNLIRDKIADENTVFKVIFLIDDVSILGSSCIDDDGEWQPIVLACCKEFLGVIEKSYLLDGVLAVSSCDDKGIIWFIDRSQINEYYLNAKDYASYRFMNLTPHVLCYSKVIPK